MFGVYGCGMLWMFEQMYMVFGLFCYVVSCGNGMCLCGVWIVFCCYVILLISVVNVWLVLGGVS